MISAVPVSSFSKRRLVPTTHVERHAPIGCTAPVVKCVAARGAQLGVLAAVAATTTVVSMHIA